MEGCCAQIHKVTARETAKRRTEVVLSLTAPSGSLKVTRRAWSRPLMCSSSLLATRKREKAVVSGGGGAREREGGTKGRGRDGGCSRLAVCMAAERGWWTANARPQSLPTRKVGRRRRKVKRIG